VIKSAVPLDQDRGALLFFWSERPPYSAASAARFLALTAAKRAFNSSPDFALIDEMAMALAIAMGAQFGTRSMTSPASHRLSPLQKSIYPTLG